MNSTTLLACALLLPAGTGTQSLHDFMETMLGTSARRSLPERSLHPTNVHHLHHVRMTALMSAPRTEGKPKCFIMSVRDPVARLKSGFAFLKKGWGPGLNKQVALPSNAARTYSGFIAAMRDPENADHRFAQGLYWSSVSKPTQAQPLHWDSVLGGHNFLVSQLDYLRGWKAHCRSGELHFMCAIIRVAHSQLASFPLNTEVMGPVWQVHSAVFTGRAGTPACLRLQGGGCTLEQRDTHPLQPPSKR